MKGLKNWFLDGRSCRYCETPLPQDKKTVEHIIPKSRGGKKGYPNKIGCCKKCNTTKGNLTPSEFLVRIEEHISIGIGVPFRLIEWELLPSVVKNLKNTFIKLEDDKRYYSNKHLRYKQDFS